MSRSVTIGDMSSSTSAPPASDSTWSTCSGDAVVPAEVRDAVDTVLGPSGLSRPEREILTTRIERWYPDLRPFSAASRASTTRSRLW